MVTQRLFAANIIAENIYSQVDEEGKRHLVLMDILDHQAKDDRVKKGDVDEYDVSYNGNKLF